MSDTRNITPQTEQASSSQEDRTYPIISGSFLPVFIADALVAYTARSVVGTFNPPVTEMVNLNQTLKGLLAASPLVSTMLTQIPMAHLIGKNGGKKAALGIIAGTLTGMSALVVISSVTDITKIDNFNLAYTGMLASGCLVGLGSGLFPLLIPIMKWTPKLEYLSVTQSTYSAIVDSSSVTTPLIIYLLKPYGYAVPFALYAGLISFGGLIAMKFLYAPPYDQLKKSYPKERAKELAIDAGQLEIMMQDDDNSSALSKIKKISRLLIDRRGIILDIAMFNTLGGFFVTETIFPSLLTNGYKVSQAEAIYASSIANLITILARLVAGKLISKLDKDSGNIKVFELGCGLIIASCIPLAFFDLPRWALYSSIAAINVGFGLSVVPPLNIARDWSKPVNENLDEYNPDDMFGLLGSIGSLGGILLPIALGLMVGELGNEGYQYYFVLIMAMMLFSAISVPVVDFNVRHKSSESIFDKSITLFSHVRNSFKNRNYTFDEAYEPERPGVA